MSRPLMRCGVAELKEIFTKSQSDLKALRQLEQELQHRQVPRAIELLTQVQSVIAARMASGASTSSASSVASVASENSRGSSQSRAPVAAVNPAGRDLFSSLEPAAAVQVSAQSNKPSRTQGSLVNTVDSLAADATPKLISIGKGSGESLPLAVVAEQTPLVTLSEAYKLLRATPSSSWESIELLRRELVHQSHPQSLKSMSADLRKQSFENARRVNAAYALLSRDRYPKL